MNAPENNINQIEFSTLLENFISENAIFRMNATNYIEEFRKQNFFGYLKSLLYVISDQNSSQLSKKVSLILSSKTFDIVSSPNQFISSYEYIEQSEPGLIDAFLFGSISLFPLFPSLSGYLFSSVAIIVCEYNENNSIIQDLCSALKQATDLNFIEAALIALEDLSHLLALLPAQYFPILEIITQYILNTEISDNIKILSLSIIKFLISIIDDAFQDQSMSMLILKSIEISISSIPTKAISYYCIGQIIKHQFPIFIAIADKIMPIASSDLNEASSSMNENLINSICDMLNKLTLKQEEDDEDDSIDEIYIKRIQILTNGIPLFFPILFKLSCSDSPFIDIPEESNSSTVALRTISRIFEAIPDESFIPIGEFVANNLFSQQSIPPVREISCAFFSFIVTFCKISQIQQFVSIFFNNQEQQTQNLTFSQQMIQIISSIFNDSHPRIKDSALNFLLSVLSRDELKYMIDHSFVLYFIPQLLQIIDEESLISIHACHNLENMLDLSYEKKEFIDLDLLSILSKLISHVDSTDNYFIFSVFECINTIIKMLNIQQIQSIIPILLNIIYKSYENPRLNRNETEFLFMFKTICECAKHRSNQAEYNCENLFLPFLDLFFQLFIENYKITQNPELLFAVSHLSSVTTSQFDRFLPIFIDIIIQSVASFDSSHESDRIRDFVAIILFLNDYFNLGPFINNLSEITLHIMVVCVSNEYNDLKSFSYSLNLFSMFIRNFFSEIADKVLPLIQVIVPIIPKAVRIDDINLQSEFLIESSVLLTHIFEKVDKNDAVEFLEIAFVLSQNIVSLIDISDTEEKDLEKILLLFRQIANVNPNLFREFFFSNENSFKFFYSLFKIKELQNTTNNFLLTVGINLDELIKEL